MTGWPLVITMLTLQAILAAGSLALVHRAMRLAPCGHPHLTGLTRRIRAASAARSVAFRRPITDCAEP